MFPPDDAPPENDCILPASSGQLRPVPPVDNGCDVLKPVPSEIFVARPKLPSDQRPARQAAPTWAVPNPEVTARCLDYPLELGPVGTASIVAAGALAQPLRTDVIVPMLSASQGDFLARMSEAHVSEILTQEVSDTRIATLTKLTAAQTAVLGAEIRRLREVARERARLQAKGALNCLYVSGQARVFCPDGAALTLDLPQLPDGRAVVNPGEADAGAVTDVRSFEAAQQGALRLASSRRACYYGNAEVIVSCQQQGFAEAVPTDEEALPLLGERRVGSVTVPANTVFSQLSKADADARARAQALAGLNCFYTNAALLLSCADADDMPEAGPPGNWDGTAVPNASIPADATLGEVGNPVFVPAGSQRSVVSTAEAAEQARVLALASLDCFWNSEEMLAVCPDFGTGVDRLQASARSPVRQVTVPVGAETSTISQADANARTLVFAQAQLQCLYCNVEIPPLCVPPYVFERPDFRLPIPREWVDATWSVDATQGVAADTYCSEDPTQVSGVAQTVATIPLSSVQAGCRYVNTPFRVGCVASTPDNIIGPFTESDRGLLSRLSYPDPLADSETARSLLIAAGAFSVYVASEADVPDDVLPGSALNLRAQAYVNQLARQTALSYLTCYFDSDAMSVTCNDIGLAGVDAQLSSTPITAEIGFATSQVSKLDANTRARASLLQQLVCVYASPEILLRCYPGVNTKDRPLPPYEGQEVGGGRLVFGDGTAEARATGAGREPVDPTAAGSVERPLALPRGFATSRTSQKDATDRALAQGAASLDCFWTNPEMTVSCGAAIDAVVVGTLSYPPPPLIGPLGDYSENSITTVVLPAGQALSYDGMLGAMRLAFRQAFGMLLCLPADPNEDIFSSLCSSMRRARVSGSKGSDLSGTGSEEKPFSSVDAAAAKGFKAFEFDDSSIYYHRTEKGVKKLVLCKSGDPPDPDGPADPGNTPGADGLPGPAGPSSGCNGDCHAFYA